MGCSTRSQREKIHEFTPIFQKSLGSREIDPSFHVFRLHDWSLKAFPDDVSWVRLSWMDFIFLCQEMLFDVGHHDCELTHLELQSMQSAMEQQHEMNWGRDESNGGSWPPSCRR